MVGVEMGWGSYFTFFFFFRTELEPGKQGWDGDPCRWGEGAECKKECIREDGMVGLVRNVVSFL